MKHGYWHDQRVDLLKKLWADGMSATQIADDFGGVTRNAVIGKVHRLGLSAAGRKQSAPQPRAPREIRMRANPRPAPHPNFSPVPIAPTPVPEPDVVDIAIPVEQRRTLMQLTDNTCRWPVGDPCMPDFFFCGARPLGESSYCDAHRRMAYQPLRAPTPRPFSPWLEGRAK